MHSATAPNYSSALGAARSDRSWLWFSPAQGGGLCDLLGVGTAYRGYVPQPRAVSVTYRQASLPPAPQQRGGSAHGAIRFDYHGGGRGGYGPCISSNLAAPNKSALNTAHTGISLSRRGRSADPGRQIMADVMEKLKSLCKRKCCFQSSESMEDLRC